MCIGINVFSCFYPLNGLIGLGSNVGHQKHFEGPRLEFDNLGRISISRFHRGIQRDSIWFRILDLARNEIYRSILAARYSGAPDWMRFQCFQIFQTLESRRGCLKQLVSDRMNERGCHGDTPQECTALEICHDKSNSESVQFGVGMSQNMGKCSIRMIRS
jgi:hypothetical protein